MEQFLYVLVAIIWIAFSLYRSQKKQKQKAALKTQNIPIVEQKTTPKFNLDSFFEELTGNKNNIFTQPEEIVSAPQNTNTGKWNYSNNLAKESVSLESESYEKQTVSLKEKEKRPTVIETNSLEIEEVKLSAFDLRKAFIYQTILTRPHN